MRKTRQLMLLTREIIDRTGVINNFLDKMGDESSERALSDQLQRVFSYLPNRRGRREEVAMMTAVASILQLADVNDYGEYSVSGIFMVTVMLSMRSSDRYPFHAKRSKSDRGDFLMRAYNAIENKEMLLSYTGECLGGESARARTP